MIILAQNVPPAISGNWLWGFVGVAMGLGAVLWCWNQLMRALGKESQRTITPQPLAVEMTKELHEQFASREEFRNHVVHNTERHGQLFNRIDKVERDSRQSQHESMEKISNQLTFIRENIAAINRELQLKPR